jgi:GTP-binding protein YchF
MLKAGIVGLPNVGKSTLFNALIRSHKAATENYPFCTIESNLGVVTVPDIRLDALGDVVRVSQRIPATIEFVDIAGLVQGASQGEGLGNRFLSHIREVDALVHVVRCFEDPDVHHVTGHPDPVRDIEIVSTELVLADLEALRRRREKISRDVKGGNKAALAEAHVLDKLEPHLDSGQPALTLSLAREERHLAAPSNLLTSRPTLLVANVCEADLGQADTLPWVEQVRAYGRNHQGCDTVIVASQLESDLADLTEEEGQAYLAESGVSHSGVADLVRQTCQLLQLRTFFTFNEREARAWTIPAGSTASQAAGRIHSDFEQGFIRAETVFWEDLVKAGSVAHARETGHYRVEGRDYEVRDGEVLLFRFHA